MRWRRQVLVIAITLVGCSGKGHNATPGTSSTTTIGAPATGPAPPSPEPKVTVARLAPVPVLFGEVVLVGNGNGNERLTDVTPAHGENEHVYDAFFTDRQHGWVGFTDFDMAAGRLVRTVDGGRTWEATNLTARQHQSAGSRVWLYFLDASSGWAVSSAAAGGASIYRSTDGGRTWSDYKSLEEARGPIEFQTARHGWMAAWAGPGPGPGLYESFDSGDTWNKHAVQPPVGIAANDLIFRLPTFHGSRGVLPAAAGDKQVAFYSSSDAGQHWHLATTVASPNAVWAGIGIASARVWWVIPDKEGPVMVTEDAGTTWSSRRRQGLPAMINDLKAKDALYAEASAFRMGDPLRLYETNDGGETWQSVNPDTGG